MKQKLSIVFLFISYTSFSQSISFNDIKTINSKDKFDRFIIENYFDDDKSNFYSVSGVGENEDEEVVVGYGHTLFTKTKKKSIVASYQDYRKKQLPASPFYGGFQMQFEFYNDTESDNYASTREKTYTTRDWIFIFEEVKAQCTFYQVGTYS